MLVTLLMLFHCAEPKQKPIKSEPQLSDRMIYSGTNKGPFKNKQARADFIQESFQSITDNKGYLTMGFVRQQPSSDLVSVGGTESEPEFGGTSVCKERHERYHDYSAVCHIFAIPQTSRTVLNTVSVSANYTQCLYVYRCV